MLTFSHIIQQYEAFTGGEVNDEARNFFTALQIGLLDFEGGTHDSAQNWSLIEEMVTNQPTLVIQGNILPELVQYVASYLFRTTKKIAKLTPPLVTQASVYELTSENLLETVWTNYTPVLGDLYLDYARVHTTIVFLCALTLEYRIHYCYLYWQELFDILKDKLDIEDWMLVNIESVWARIEQDAILRELVYVYIEVLQWCQFGALFPLLHEMEPTVDKHILALLEFIWNKGVLKLARSPRRISQFESFFGDHATKFVAELLAKCRYEQHRSHKPVEITELTGGVHYTQTQLDAMYKDVPFRGTTEIDNTFSDYMRKFASCVSSCFKKKKIYQYSTVSPTVSSNSGTTRRACNTERTSRGFASLGKKKGTSCEATCKGTSSCSVATIVKLFLGLSIGGSISYNVYNDYDTVKNWIQSFYTQTDQYGNPQANKDDVLTGTNRAKEILMDSLINTDVTNTDITTYLSYINDIANDHPNIDQRKWETLTKHGINLIQQKIWCNTLNTPVPSGEVSNVQTQINEAMNTCTNFDNSNVLPIWNSFYEKVYTNLQTTQSLTDALQATDSNDSSGNPLCIVADPLVLDVLTSYYDTKLPDYTVRVDGNTLCVVSDQTNQFDQDYLDGLQNIAISNGNDDVIKQELCTHLKKTNIDFNNVMELSNQTCDQLYPKSNSESQSESQSEGPLPEL